MEIKREHHLNFWYVVIAFLLLVFIQGQIYRHAKFR